MDKSDRKAVITKTCTLKVLKNVTNNPESPRELTHLRHAQRTRQDIVFWISMSDHVMTWEPCSLT